MAREGWGLFGPDDEIGAARRITAHKRASAARLVREGRCLSLAQPLSRDTPVPRHRAGVQHFMDRDGGDYAAGRRAPGGFQFAEDTVMMPVHVGTHVDALCHVWTEDQIYNGHSGHEITSTRGARRCGIEKLPPLVSRGVLLDLVALRGEALADGESSTREDLIEAARRAGVELEAGDVVLVHTGWFARQAGRSRLEVDFDTEPGLDVSAALWLAEAGVAAVGADNFAIEAMPFPDGQVFPVHQRLIRDYGISLIEGLVLEPLAMCGVATFLFVAAPLPLVGATGSPLTPLAIF